MYNARWISQFFPTEHGEEFLSDWYDWETEEQPVVPDGPDAVFPDDPVFHGPDENEVEVDFPEVPVPHGPDALPEVPRFLMARMKFLMCVFSLKLLQSLRLIWEDRLI